jgi:hypothetical protein
MDTDTGKKNQMTTSHYIYIYIYTSQFLTCVCITSSQLDISSSDEHSKPPQGLP